MGMLGSAQRFCAKAGRAASSSAAIKKAERTQSPFDRVIVAYPMELMLGGSMARCGAAPCRKFDRNLPRELPEIIGELADLLRLWRCSRPAELWHRKSSGRHSGQAARPPSGKG